MKKILISALFLALFASCSGPSNLYNWGRPHNSDNYTRYDELSYNSFDKQSPESMCELLCFYEYMIKNPGGARNVIPPGICAEYGYLLLKPETAGMFLQYATAKQKKVFGDMDDYSSYFHERGLELLEREMELYPESAIFLSPIIKQMSN